MNLGSTKTTTLDIEMIVPYCRALKELDVECCCGVATVIARALRKMPDALQQLEVLNLESTYSLGLVEWLGFIDIKEIVRQRARQFGEIIVQCLGLRVLNLHGCGGILTDIGTTIQKNSQVLQKLERLDISAVEDDQKIMVGHIERLLGHCTQLRDIDLQGGVSELKAVFAVLKTNPEVMQQLKKLRIKKPDSSPDTMSQLQAKLPTCELNFLDSSISCSPSTKKGALFSMALS